jgi:hypothetical protein
MNLLMREYSNQPHSAQKGEQTDFIAADVWKSTYTMKLVYGISPSQWFFCTYLDRARALGYINSQPRFLPCAATASIAAFTFSGSPR